MYCTSATILEDQHNTILHFITPFITMFPVEVFLNRPREREVLLLRRANVYNDYIKIILTPAGIITLPGTCRAIPETYLHCRAFPVTIRTPEPGFSRDSPNSRAGLFPRISELPSRAFPVTLRTPELMTLQSYRVTPEHT